MSYLTRKKEAMLFGSPVVPYDLWQQWVYLAGLTVGDYADLAAVIASSTARTALTANTAAGKAALIYMVNSTSVIMPAVVASADFVTALNASAYAITIPTMTTNSAPSGTASSTSTSSGYEAYKAFDKNAGTYSWNINVGLTPPWDTKYAFANSTHLYKVIATVKSPHSDTNPFTYSIQHSNNNTDWTTLATYTAESFTGAEAKTKTLTVLAPLFKYVRVNVTTFPSGYPLNVAEVTTYSLNLS